MLNICPTRDQCFRSRPGREPQPPRLPDARRVWKGSSRGRRQDRTEAQQRLSSNDGITSAMIRKPKLSAHRCRTPGFLRIAPVNSGQQLTELGRRNRAVGRAWPQKPPALQPLGEQASRRQPVPPRCRRQLPGCGVTLRHDPLLLIQRPTTTRTRRNHVEPRELQLTRDSARRWMKEGAQVKRYELTWAFAPPFCCITAGSIP